MTAESQAKEMSSFCLEYSEEMKARIFLVYCNKVLYNIVAVKAGLWP